MNIAQFTRISTTTSYIKNMDNTKRIIWYIYVYIVLSFHSNIFCIGIDYDLYVCVTLSHQLPTHEGHLHIII